MLHFYFVYTILNYNGKRKKFVDQIQTEILYLAFSMLNRIPFALLSFSLAGSLYLHKYKIQLDNPYLRIVIKTLHTQNPNYSSFLLKNMINFQMIKQNAQMKNFVMSEGFDFDGNYIEGLALIGFDTVQVGPVSLIPSCSQQKRVHFGAKIPLANINTFIQNRKNNQKQTKIGVSIAPNFEVLRYTPYLIEENIIETIKQFETLNENPKSLSINRYILKLNEKDMKQIGSAEYLSMIKSLIENSHRIVDETLQKKLKDTSSAYSACKPDIFVQIPSREQNPKVLEALKLIPGLKNLIIEGKQFDILADTKNEKTLKLVEGRKRISLEQLIQKIIHEKL